MSTIAPTVIDHPFVKTMAPEYVEVLSKNAQEIEFVKGEMLFRQGEPANRFFLIESGKVSLECRSEDGQDILVQTVGAGDVLGWSWLFPPFSWHFQARVVEPGRAIVLDGGHLLVTCEEHPRFGYELMKRLTHVVIQRLENESKKLIAAEGRKERQKS